MTLLVQEISPSHKKSLEKLTTKNVQINLFKINYEMVNPIHNRQGNYLRGQFFTMLIFYRLFIPELFPHNNQYRSSRNF